MSVKDAIVESAIKRTRTTVLLMTVILVFGLVARLSIPIEASPNIEVPFFVVTVIHEGISPEDATRLIVMPIEQEFSTIEGLKELTAFGSEGAATVIAEFEAEADLDESLTDIREAMDRAKPKLPASVEEPIITEQSTSDFPIVQVNLVGEDVPDRLLYRLARDLQDEVETIADVLEAQIQGEREELLEVVIDPSQLDAYEISAEQLASILLRNNRLIAAGSLASGEGSISVKVPSVIETAKDFMNLPVKVSGDTVVTLSEIATVRRTFKDYSSFARVNGTQSISLNIIKRADSNLIDTVANVREVADAWSAVLPKSISLLYSNDQAPYASSQVNELQGNIVTALVLIMILIVGTMGFRSGLIVGAAIPVSFLFALIVLWLFGYSFNFMVMFGMLLGLGMLIDGAIVITEYADRKLVEGFDKSHAYALAAKRMFWPVTASVGTTLMAFAPLLFWPGVSGKFMSYLPVTVFAVLSGSLLYALVFGPTLGSIFGKASTLAQRSKERWEIMEQGDPRTLPGVTGFYAHVLGFTCKYSLLTVVATISILVGSFVAYTKTDLGMTFFSDSEPARAQLTIRARGNLDVFQAFELVKRVEESILDIPGIEALNSFASSGGGGFGSRSGRTAPDSIGGVYVSLYDETERELTGTEIFELMREKTSVIAGIIVEIQAVEDGPPVGKPVQIEFSATTGELLTPIVSYVRAYIDNNVEGLRDVEDTRPIPGVQWNVQVDRAQAAIFGADVSLVGIAIQLVTNGIFAGEFRPDDANEAVDIRVRFPEDKRGTDMLDQLKISTSQGLVPISNFVSRTPSPRVPSIERRDRKVVQTIRANVAPGVLADAKVREIQGWLETQSFDPRVNIYFRGANEEQQNSIAFITRAFMLALSLMFILLVTQFNSLYQSAIILFAVIMSTAGVLLGLIITNQPFSAILTGVGIVALAGIVVNNNIVLIDTFNLIRRLHPELDAIDVIIRTGAQRFRPVMLTTLTTITGLLPLASHLSIDFVNNSVVVGGELSGFWVPLAQAIVFGLTFATLLTLVATPAMLAMPSQIKSMWRHGRLVAFLTRRSAPPIATANLDQAT